MGSGPCRSPASPSYLIYLITLSLAYDEVQTEVESLTLFNLSKQLDHSSLAIVAGIIIKNPNFGASKLKA